MYFWVVLDATCVDLDGDAEIRMQGLDKTFRVTRGILYEDV